MHLQLTIHLGAWEVLYIFTSNGSIKEYWFSEASCLPLLAAKSAVGTEIPRVAVR